MGFNLNLKWLSVNKTNISKVWFSQTFIERFPGNCKEKSVQVTCWVASWWTHSHASGKAIRNGPSDWSIHVFLFDQRWTGDIPSTSQPTSYCSLSTYGLGIHGQGSLIGSALSRRHRASLPLWKTHDAKVKLQPSTYLGSNIKTQEHIHPSIVCKRSIPFMGSQGFLLEPLPAVSRRGQLTPWISCWRIAGPSLMVEDTMQGANCTSGAIWGSVSCSRTLRHAAQLSPDLGFEPVTFQSLADLLSPLS